jgi:hypothetical protein
MTKTHSRIVAIRKWFPHNEPFAAKIARLCILREDFLLESQGVRINSITALDEHSRNWRIAYFFRKMTSTLAELAGAVNRILSDPDFKRLLDKQPTDIKIKFANIGRQLAQGQPTTKEIRNAICAHVLESEVQKALERVDDEAFGIFEIAPKPNKTHMKFAYELVAEILLGDVPKQKRAKAFETKIGKVTDMFFLFSAIDHIVVIYAKDKGLLKF